MFGRKKGFTASQSKRMSRRMQSSTIGTHVVRDASTGRKSRGGSSRDGASGASRVEFSNNRRASEAHRGYVSQVGTTATSGESDSAYSRRVSRLGYVQEIQRRKKRRRIAFVAMVVALVLVVSVGAGVAAYYGSSDSKLSLGDSNASEALVDPESGEPYYILCAAQLGSAGKDRGAQTDAYLLVRVDEADRVLTFVSVPSNLLVRLSDGQTHPLYDAREVGGDAELISQVAELADVDIAHFAMTDAQGIIGMLDAVGGVSVTVSEEVDDPQAGTTVLFAGEQSLKGQEALVYLRATNYSNGIEGASANRVSFTVALAQQALTAEGLSFAALVGDAGNYVNTDLTSSELMALGDALRPLDEATVYTCVVPGSETDDDPALCEYSESQWTDMLSRVKAGEDPNAIDSSAENVNPADVTVEVRNGAGTTGAASSLGDTLSAAGYVVEGVGNVDDGTTYPETLIIYKDESNEGAAKAVLQAVGSGRIVMGGDFYTLSTDVLVIIGKDWMPVS